MHNINPHEIERRCVSSSEIRVDGDTPKIIGYAAVFNTWTDIGGWFRESIKPGAFAKSITSDDVRALLNHDQNYVLGRNRAGTLRMSEDSKGLLVEIDPAPTTWANDLLVSMRRGDVSQMSFGFRANKTEVNSEKNERTLADVTLFDVSVVTFPAYPTTTAQVRSIFKTAANQEQKPDKWARFDEIVAKFKRGERLTDEEIRALYACLPVVAGKSDKKTGDRIANLLARAERIAPDNEGE